MHTLKTESGHTFKKGGFMQKYHSGDTVPMSCNYKAYDKNGQSQDDEKTYLNKGETFPPTQHSGSYWVMDMEKGNQSKNPSQKSK